MADLDDFFAKKDKKKSKGKKFTTTDEVAKKLEETGKRVIEKPKLREKSTNNPEDEAGETPQIEEEEEEWREFEEEKKDYTGLKIGNLQVSDNLDGDSDDERGTGNNSEENESGEAGSSGSGPWKKKDGQKDDGENVSTNSSSTGTTSAAPAPPAAAAAASTGPAKYKPPSLRNQEKMPLGRSRMRNVAPDIRSEEYFPQLSGKQQSTQDSSNTWGRRKRDEGTFEEVKKGGSRAYSLQDAQSQAPKLSLDNKYGALSQDQS